MLIDQTLVGRYTILEHVGGGGMADVYKAHDNLLDRDVAIKVLRSQFTHDEDFVRRFRREAQAAAKLSHPNIVNIYDVGEDGDVHYIVMEYIAGETLKQKINREGALSVELSLQIAYQIGEALLHAHHNNLVHCDIKPHNILINRAGRIKVTDFGIARAVTSTTMTNTGTIIGSVHYLSPEQARGGAAGPRSDLYSLGVVMYEMLTGRVPFVGESPIAIALKQLQEEPQPPHELNQGIPAMVEGIILKAMQKDPQLRYPSGEEMLHDIDLGLSYYRDDQTRRIAKEDLPTMVLPRVTELDQGLTGNSALKPLPKRSRRKGWYIALVVLLLLSGFAVGMFMAFGKFWSSNEVTVPNVVGKPVEQAKTILINAKLRVNVVGETYSDQYPPGAVITQTPVAGSTVKESRMINLVINKGGESVSVPELRGLSRNDAEAQLQNLGLNIGMVTEEFSNTAKAYTIMGQNPRPGVIVSRNSSIDITISKGPPKKSLVVPDFRGLTLDAVKNQITSLGLQLGNVTEKEDSSAPGTVLDQSPKPGTEATEGAVIDLVVSKVSGTLKRGTVQIVVPSGPSSQPVQIVVVDAAGRRVVYDAVHKPGDRISKTVDGTGDVKVQVYINRALVQEQAL